jgi:hypothetical protein
MDDDRGRGQLQAVLLKGLAVVAGICVVIALGTLIMVKALGLDSGGGGGDGSATPAALEPEPATPLPTTALPVPGQSDQPASGQGGQHGPGKHRHQTKRDNTSAKGFHLTATPAFVKPMQRINLTGTYPHHDNMSVVVQRFDGGQWSSFAGVDASVDLGTFQTYVMTGRSGDNRFRMFDPSTGKASNAVTVTVG